MLDIEQCYVEFEFSFKLLHLSHLCVYLSMLLCLSNSYKWMIPFTYTTDANINWSDPENVWMEKSDGK